MKYKLIGENDFLFNPVETILKNREVKGTDSFLNLDVRVVNDWKHLKNIDKAVNCLLKHLNMDSHVYIQIDSDADGYLSSASTYNYLKRIAPNIKITWGLHESKAHGVNLQQVPEDAQLVIIPDAGSNQYEEHQILHDKGVDVIVLDHHHCEYESEHAIVVNNQLSPDYPNKNFSGVGIVYKFCQALDHHLNVNYADEFLDLVAVGNIADNVDMRELETRYYVINGLKQIKNPFLKALIEKQDYSMKGKINITNISFYISPLINAVVRSGTMDEKEQVFKCLTESDEMVYYKKRDTWESIHVNTARQTANVRVRQNKLRDKGVELINERIIEKELNLNKVLMVNVTGLLEKSLSGLVANKLIDKYKKPVVLLRQYEDNEELFGGSARGYEKSEIKNFRQFLLDTGMFNFCEGHDNAFGYEINKSKIVKVNEYINEILKDVEMGSDVYEVDFIIPAAKLSPSLIKDLNKMRDLWGFRVQEPLLVIEDIPLTQKDIKYPDKEKGTVLIKYKDIEFVKYQADSSIMEKLREHKSLKLTVVGRANENVWKDKVTPQLIIDDFDVIKNRLPVF